MHHSPCLRGLVLGCWLALAFGPCLACGDSTDDGAATAADAGGAFAADDAGSSPTTAQPSGPSLPTAQEACPTLADGELQILGRDARVWRGDSSGGALLLYWPSTGSVPTEAVDILGSALDAVLADGGLVVAFAPGGGSGDITGPGWYFEDVGLADEAVACAVEQDLIDPERIHSVGLGGGAIHTAALLFGRQGYLASVVSYHGGVLPTFRSGPGFISDPENKIAALWLHGGPTDQQVVNFQQLAMDSHADLKAMGHMSILCEGPLLNGDHSAYADDLWRFLESHPYKAPSPWADGLPDDFEPGCML